MNISEMAVSIAKVNYCLYLECSHALDKYNKNPWADHNLDKKLPSKNLAYACPFCWWFLEASMVGMLQTEGAATT